MLCLHWILLVVYFQHSFLMPCYALIDMLSYAMIEIKFYVLLLQCYNHVLICHVIAMLVDVMILYMLS